MAIRSRLLSRSLPGLALTAVMLVTAAVSAQAPKSNRLMLNTVGGKSTLSVSGEQSITVRQSANAISDQRLIAMPGTQGTVVMWKEMAKAAPAAGQQAIEQSFYSVSLDGKTFSDPRPTSYQIKLRFAKFDPLAESPVVPERLATVDLRAQGRKSTAASGSPQDSGAKSETQLYIVQFVAPPSDRLVNPILALGAIPRAYLAEHAHVVEMSPAVRDQVAAIPLVRWVGPYHAAYKLEEPLVAELAGDASRAPTRRYSIMLFERGPVPQQIVANRIAALGGVINARISEGFRIEAHTAQPVAVVTISVDIRNWNQN